MLRFLADRLEAGVEGSGTDEVAESDSEGEEGETESEGVAEGVVENDIEADVEGIAEDGGVVEIEEEIDSVGTELLGAEDGCVGVEAGDVSPPYVHSGPNGILGP